MIISDVILDNDIDLNYSIYILLHSVEILEYQIALQYLIICIHVGCIFNIIWYF